METPFRLDRPALVSNLLGGVPWVLLLAIASPPLALAALGYVVAASAFLASTLVRDRPTWTQEALAWAAPWIAAVALWTWIGAQVDGETASPPQTIWFGLAIATPSYLAWQVTALAVRQALHGIGEAGRPTTGRRHRRLRRTGTALALLVAVAATGAPAITWLGQNRVVAAGDVAVAVEGRHVDYAEPFASHDPTSVGTGSGGRIGLVDGACVGFVGTRPDQHDVVIVWPYGTTVTGTGDELAVHYAGRRVGLGDEVDGGSDLGHDLSGIREALPPACRDHDLALFDPTS